MADIVLAPAATVTGVIERVLLHEAPTPYFPIYDADESFKAMRLMRQVLRNRLKHPKDFGVPGAKDEMDVVRNPSQFAGFGKAPNMSAAFMLNVTQALEIANNPRHAKQAAFRRHVEQAITAATEASPPAEFRLPNLYYWRTGKHSDPGKRTRLYRRIQGLDFYLQDDLD